MVTNKTTKALSLLLPVALLISTNLNAIIDAEVSTTGTRIINIAKNTFFVLVGAGLARSSYAKVADAGKTTVKQVFSVDADGKNIVDRNHKVIAAVETKPDIAATNVALANANNHLDEAARTAALNDALKDIVKADVLASDKVKNALADSGKDVAGNTNWTAVRGKFALNDSKNPFATNSNAMNVYAPAIGAIALISAGVHGLAQEAGLCCNADVEEVA